MCGVTWADRRVRNAWLGASASASCEGRRVRIVCSWAQCVRLRGAGNSRLCRLALSCFVSVSLSWGIVFMIWYATASAATASGSTWERRQTTRGPV